MKKFGARPASRTPSLSEKLIARADVEAELLVGIIRMIVALILIVAIFAVISIDDQPVAPWVERDVVYSIITVASYFSLGAVGVLVVQAGVYRSWMAWCFTLLEVILIALNISLGITNADASSLFALAGIGAALLPIALALGILRLRSRLQIINSLILIIAVTYILFLDPRSNEPGLGLTNQVLEETFSPVSNGFRLVMLLIVAGIVSVAVWHGRRLLEQVARESEKIQNQKRFLPIEITEHMTDESLAGLRAGSETAVLIRECFWLIVTTKDWDYASELAVLCSIRLKPVFAQ